MLRYFILPQKDEAFYSLLARFREHLNLTTYKANKTLFGNGGIRHNILLPNKILEFSERVGNAFGLTYQKIHDNHTLLGLFKKFNQQFTDFEQINGPMRLFGKESGSIEKFKYCPVCLKESLSAIGEPYWNRLHNIPYLQICVSHKVRLAHWSPSVDSIIKYDIHPASAINNTSQIRNEKNSLVLDLTSETIACISNDFKPNLDDLILKAKESELLILKGRNRFMLNNDHYKSLNEFVKEATLNVGEDAISILRSIRHMLFKTIRTVPPYAYLTLLSYINNHHKIPSLKTTHEVDQANLLEMRSRWVNELNSPNFISIEVSMKKLHSDSSWLLKNDYFWFYKTNQRKRLKYFQGTYGKLTIPKADNQIVEEIKKKKEELIGISEMRVSKILILRLPEFRFLTTTALKLLPNTSDFLKNNLETKFDFKKRKIYKFMKDNRNALPSKRDVMIKFTINRSKCSAQQVMELIEIINRFY